MPALPGYLTAMKKVCRRHGVLFILDEVMCGMGRTGYIHAWQQENVVPDIQLVGKCLGGGHTAISAMLVSQEIYDAFVDGPGTGIFNHGHTFQNFPLACAAGLAVQRIVLEDGLLANVRDKGEKLMTKLVCRLGTHPHVGNIRGAGLFRGVSFREVSLAKSLHTKDRIRGRQSDQGAVSFGRACCREHSRVRYIILEQHRDTN